MKGNGSEPGNYRPVSLTCIVCKVIERIIKNDMTEHLAEYNVINNCQHFFTKDRSCLTILLEFLEEVYEKLDKGRAVDVIYTWILHFKHLKRFPTKDWVKRWKRADLEGTYLHVYRWIENWLKDRKQRVGIRGAFSE